MNPYEEVKKDHVVFVIEIRIMTSRRVLMAIILERSCKFVLIKVINNCMRQFVEFNILNNYAKSYVMNYKSSSKHREPNHV